MSPTSGAHASSSLQPAGAAPRRRSWLLPLGLFLMVLGARLWLIAGWGSAIPKLDEWDATGLNLFLPSLDGQLGWEQLTRPQNEHRIILTRLLDLAVFRGTGLWSPWIQMALNAVLHASTAVLLLALRPGGISRGNTLLFVGACAVVLGGPMGWQNALWGFQSQFFLCALLGVAALRGMSTAPGGWRWAAGGVALVLAQLSMGNALLLCVALLPLCTWNLVTERQAGHRGPWLAGLLISSLVLAAALCFRTSPAANEGLHAQDTATLLGVFARCLAWPFMSQPVLALLLHAPALLLIGRLLRQKEPPQSWEAFALVVWTLGVLNAAGIAWARGAGLVEGIPLSRYQDTLMPATLANLALLLGGRHDTWPRRLLRFAHLGALAVGTALLCLEVFTVKLPLQHKLDSLRLEMLRDFENTGELAVFNQAPPLLRPHPDALVLARVLREPRLRQALPRDFSEEAPWGAATGCLILALGLGCLVPAMRQRHP